LSFAKHDEVGVSGTAAAARQQSAAAVDRRGPGPGGATRATAEPAVARPGDAALDVEWRATANSASYFPPSQL